MRKGGKLDEDDDLEDFKPTDKNADARRAFMENLLVVAADDAKNVTLISTVAVGAAAFAAKEIAGPLSEEHSSLKILGLVAIVLLLAGAGLLYFYAAAVNLTRMTIVRKIVSLDARGARDVWAGEKSGIAYRKGWLLQLGAIVLLIGVVACSAVAAILFMKS